MLHDRRKHPPAQLTEEPPVTAAPVQRRRPKDRRQSIEAAAAELFAARGFAGTGMADIAAEVGITPGAIYRHFSSKEDLLERIVLGSVSRIGTVLDAITSRPDASGADQVLALIPALLDMTQANRDFVATYLRERRRLTDAGLVKRRAAEGGVVDRISVMMTEATPGITPLDAAMRLRALNGTLTSVATRHQSVPWARLRELFQPGLEAVLLAPADRPAAPAQHPPRQWSPPRSRREEILEAASRLFRQHGYHGVGIDEIGEAAGIAGPTVYGNYAGKADILVDAIDRAISTVEVLTNQALDQAGSAREALLLFAGFFAETVMSNLDIVVVAGRETEALPEGGRARVARAQADFRQRWAVVLVELRPDLTQPEARALLAASFAAVEDVAVERQAGKPSTESVADLMLRFLLVS
jgi:AcrR family transcriptional regulator